MDVITKESLSGYIAQKAELKRGLDNTAVLVCKLGQKHYRREPDRSFTLIGTSYISLVIFGASAEAADERFTVGDDIVAFGSFRPRSYERDGQQVEVIEFRTNKLLFDTSHPRYEVHRTSRGDLTVTAATERSPDLVTDLGEASFEDPEFEASGATTMTIGR